MRIDGGKVRDNFLNGFVSVHIVTILALALLTGKIR
jgi:hypothetical protein